jgi:hypothetical protein
MSGGKLFGAPISGKGVAAAVGQGRGTMVAPFRAIGKEVDGTASVTFQSITAMVQYEHKSFEELRWEDYMAGNKGSQEQAQPGPGGFGSSCTTAEFGLVMDMDVLHRIYHFDGRDLPSDQSEESCWKLCSIFGCFAKEMVRYL